MIVQASKHYKITKREVNILIQPNKWDLLHENTSKSINRTINRLKEKLEIHKMRKNCVKQAI